MMVYILCGDGDFERREGAGGGHGMTGLRAMHSERETPTVCRPYCRDAVQGVWRLRDRCVIGLRVICEAYVEWVGGTWHSENWGFFINYIVCSANQWKTARIHEYE